MKIVILAVLLLALYTSNCLTIHHQAQRNITGDYGDTLYPGESLKEGEDYLSTGTGMIAKVQEDGNFVVSDGGVKIWSTELEGQGLSPRRLTLQTDGNIVFYDAKDTPLWASNTEYPKGKGQFKLVLQNDKALVLYDGKNPIWSTGQNL